MQMKSIRVNWIFQMIIASLLTHDAGGKFPKIRYNLKNINMQMQVIDSNASIID